MLKSNKMKRGEMDVSLEKIMKIIAWIALFTIIGFALKNILQRLGII